MSTWGGDWGSAVRSDIVEVGGAKLRCARSHVEVGLFKLGAQLQCRSQRVVDQ